MTPVTPHVPTQDEIQLARASSRVLASSRPHGVAVSTLKVVAEDGTEKAVTIPSEALSLLVEILTQLGQGNAVTVMPVHAELTTQQAAGLLGVSRPHLVKLLDSGEIPHHMVGTHRRIYYQDVSAYKQKVDGDRLNALNELTAQAQDLGLGY